MAGVEAANELIQAQRRFPDLTEELAAIAAAYDSSRPVDGGIESFVAGATAIELSRTDLHAGFLIH